MQAKLILTLDSDVIERAKRFSHRHHKSLSKLVENYLRQITLMAPEQEPVPPLVAELLKSQVVNREQAGHSEPPAGEIALKLKP